MVTVVMDVRVIKGVLREELENSKRIKKQYERALKSLPKGSLVEKKIRGHKYFYLEYREKGKVKFDYMGRSKDISQDEIEKYAEVKKLRVKYRKLLSEANKQISFLKRVLNGRELRSLS